MNKEIEINVDPEFQENTLIIKESFNNTIPIAPEEDEKELDIKEVKQEENVSIQQEIISVEVVNAERYKGEYTFSPLAYQEQTIATKKKYLENNITIKKVPYYEVSNTTNGTTIYIASEV